MQGFALLLHEIASSGCRPLRNDKERSSLAMAIGSSDYLFMSPIQSKVFQHEQEYFFKFHAPKLESLTKNEPRLRDYLLEVYHNCPDEFFCKSLRCSQTKLKNVELRKRARNNSAVERAKSALRGIKDNKMRHPAVQDFMLAQDSATIACEVPVYLAPWEVPGMDRPLSGHIDILQIRGGEIAASPAAPRNDSRGVFQPQIWILDYKPNARYNVQRYLTQVFLYKVCLSRRTKIPMDRIGAAYFDDTHYFEVSVARQGELM